MTRTAVSLQDQIALAERRVQLEKLQLKVAARGLRSSALTVVSGPIGMMALFLAAGVAGSIGGRKARKKEAGRARSWAHPAVSQNGGTRRR